MPDETQSRTQPAPHVIVVSLHKAGTHLMKRLMEEMGYEVTDPETGVTEAAKTQDPETFLSALKPNSAYFFHALPIHTFPLGLLQHWRKTGSPPVYYNYRDPRAVLLSQVNYLLQRNRAQAFTETRYHLLFSDILQAQKTEAAALDVAIECMADYLNDNFLGSLWMLHHPRVCRVSYERLVGPSGGGTAESHAAEVNRVLAHANSRLNPDQLSSRLYDPTQRTFHRGQAYAWKDVYSQAQLRAFNEKYRHLLKLYGYDPVE